MPVDFVGTREGGGLFEGLGEAAGGATFDGFRDAISQACEITYTGVSGSGEGAGAGGVPVE